MLKDKGEYANKIVLMNDSPRSTFCVIIVAAGRGRRAGLNKIPKQYRKIGDLSVLQRTIQVFSSHAAIKHIMVVTHSNDDDFFDHSIRPHPKLLSPVNGGTTRRASVLKGLDALEFIDPDYVLIHDAARPFITAKLIDRIVTTLTPDIGVVPAIAVSDTIKKVDNSGLINSSLSHKGLFFAQTPQAFPYRIIKKAHYNTPLDASFTDDSAIAENFGLHIKIIEGERTNTKITTRFDIDEAQKRVANMIPDIRTGHGYDVHTLVQGNSITLCGIKIKHHRSLSGHSDSDVALHALTDALLATISSGDIGKHFPPSDQKWKGAESSQFLLYSVNRVIDSGGTITHLDITLICESPTIETYRDAMRYSVSTITGVSIDRISVKGTTNERIGFIGREEGIAALATASVVMVNS
ncbi:bifunctional 2-C-methyl-D-erythritol 4-phosphate cytidylyltransferase/2-C-methyl-D-erythritol 2,4-cyclodiphosphate synthase [Candidatus Endowatersipora endosymbiont of Watersipora subatra]|uniref:bifunctional 2-C-methyl-D-erythritol 4-phosphate cytidylyltransferase/2-C-methyl-D-erythritol 2,4-cyclodiphosphate synthase n=1 Tax=Candidatus Endowatersipora endosymbiont of Watersipora subatra TaxID=3077946 RepID=UPI003C7DCBA2